MSWRVLRLLVLVVVAVVAESVMLSSEDYTRAHIVAGGAIVVAGFLAYLWWKLLGALTRVVMTVLVAFVLLAVVAGLWDLTN